MSSGLFALGPSLLLACAVAGSIYCCKRRGVRLRRLLRAAVGALAGISLSAVLAALPILAFSFNRRPGRMGASVAAALILGVLLVAGGAAAGALIADNEGKRPLPWRAVFLGALAAALLIVVPQAVGLRPGSALEFLALFADLAALPLFCWSARAAPDETAAPA